MKKVDKYFTIMFVITIIECFVAAYWVIKYCELKGEDATYMCAGVDEAGFRYTIIKHHCSKQPKISFNGKAIPCEKIEQ